MKNIMKKIGTVMLLVPALVLGVGFFAPMQNASADCTPSGGLGGAIGGNNDCIQSGAGTSGLQTRGLFDSGNGIVSTVINVMLFIIGILCVVMIIFSGIRYTISRGKQEEVKAAKDTLMYSIVGLIIAIIAYAVVNWVFGAISGN